MNIFNSIWGAIKTIAPFFTSWKLGKDSANAKGRKKNNDASDALNRKRMHDKRK